MRAAATTDAAIGSTWTDIGDSADRELLLLSLCGLCRTRHRTCYMFVRLVSLVDGTHTERN